MSLEQGRSLEEQEAFEAELVKDLENAYYATNKWSDKEAPDIYKIRYIDTMIRIQADDVHGVQMNFETDPAGHEVVNLKLPIPRFGTRDFVMTLTYRLNTLEKYEPNIRDLLPTEV